MNAQPMNQQPTNGFQVPPLGGIVRRKMVSIGSLDRPKITSGPKYFSADINDEQEFPEPSLTPTPKTDVREYRVVQTESFRKKKLSKVRRDKMRKIPLVEFLSDDCRPCECEHEGSGVPAPPEPEGKREKRAVVGDRRRKRTRFASVRCADADCGSCEPRVIDQRDKVDFVGSNQESPPVADDDRPMLTAEIPEQSMRRHIKSKPRSILGQWTRMSGAERINIRRAQRLVEAQTSIPRSETNEMSVKEVTDMSKIIQAELDEKAEQQRQLEESQNSDPGMCDDSDTEEEEWNGSVFSAFGDTDDEGQEGDKGPQEDVEQWDSEAEIGESTFSEYEDNDEEPQPEAAKASQKFGNWLKEHPNEFMSAIKSLEPDIDECKPEHRFMPDEARAFLKCIGMFRCGPQGSTVINSVTPPHKSGWKKMRITVTLEQLSPSFR